MDVLLRELRDGPGGVAVYRDTELQTKEVSIGCAADQRIQLLGRSVGAKHAIIRGKTGRLSLSCLGGRRALVNGAEKTGARLAIGDHIEIGGHRLTILQTPPGFDVAIELRPNASIDSSDFEAAFRTDLGQTWIGKRRIAWLLIALTGLVGFLVPFGSRKARHLPKQLPAWVPSGVVRAAGRLPAWVPSDVMWSTGPLSPGHQQLTGDRCESCHQTLFQRVEDTACTSCHGKTADHVESARLAQTSLGPTERCAACHREHDEPNDLVDRSDKGCLACHAEPARRFGALKVQAVAGFGAGRHPAFGSTARALEAAKSPSALVFSHPQHLDGARVRGGRGPLACADCHELSTDGQHFLPTTMESHCSSCHELTFDPAAPDRQLPHGKPREVVRMLEDYFARKLTDPNAGKKATTLERRRLPDHEEPAEEAPCQASTFACAMRSATAEMETQFLRRGCVTCHQIKDTRNKDLVERFEVTPIRLALDFYPAARFPHARHLVQGSVTGDGACLSCHPAAESRELRVPDVSTCENCHSDRPMRDRTRVQCVSCHVYHPHS
jgi:hypothetical protein